VKTAADWVRPASWSKVRETLAVWWANPLLRHARREHPLALRRVRMGILIAGASLAGLATLAWAINFRPLGALLMAMSLGGVLAPALIAPVASADRVARQMHYSRQDPRRLTDLSDGEIVDGLALVTLWRLRWLIVIGLALTPALIIGVLRLDVSEFTIWRDSAQVLAAATPAARAPFLRSDGVIPVFRLVLRAVSAGLMPWAALPLLASLGVTAALRVGDLALSALVALLGEIVGVLVLWLLWDFLTRIPLLAGWLEGVRLLLIFALCGAMLVGIGYVSQWNLRLLAESRRLLLAPDAPIESGTADEESTLS
jgi:predicted membrane protein